MRTFLAASIFQTNWTKTEEMLKKSSIIKKGEELNNCLRIRGSPSSIDPYLGNFRCSAFTFSALWTLASIYSYSLAKFNTCKICRFLVFWFAWFLKIETNIKEFGSFRMIRSNAIETWKIFNKMRKFGTTLRAIQIWV